MRFVKFFLVAALGLTVIPSFADAAMTDKPFGAAKGIRMTRHNLSNWGLYDVKAGNTGDPRETQVCIFCHTPHNADSREVPLWGHKDTAAGFTMASSYYIKATGGTSGDTQPTGISKKCLSCHDGTVGIGRLTSGSAITVVTGGGTDAEGYPALSQGINRGYIGTNLTSGHVISFKYDDSTFFNNASTYTKLVAWANISTSDKKSMFDRDGKMQCHSCHDPHTDWCDDPSKTVGPDPLWRKKCDGSGKNSSVCKVCHKITFSGYTQAFPYGGP